MKRAATTLTALLCALGVVVGLAGATVASGSPAERAPEGPAALGRWPSAQGFSVACAAGVECLLWSQTAAPTPNAVTRPELFSWHPDSSVPTPVAFPSFSGTITALGCVPGTVCTADVERNGPSLVLGSGKGANVGRQVSYQGAYVADPRTNAWRRIDVPSNSLSSLTCVSLRRCFQVLSGVVATTEDGGRHWSVSHLPDGFSVSSVSPSGTSCVSATTCLVLGTESPSPASVPRAAILRSTDAGSTWQVLPAPIAAWSLSCTLEVCEASNFSDAVASVDAGRQWHRINVPASDTAQDLTCWSLVRCVEMRSDGRVIVSDDGGATWALRPGDAYNDSIGTSCLSTSSCILVGTDNLGSGWPSVTTDGGRSWVPLVVPAAISVAQLACRTTSSCLAVLDNHPILALSIIAENQVVQDRSSLASVSPTHLGVPLSRVGASDATYEGVACDVTWCTVVGSRIDARTDDEVGLVLVRSTSGPWRQVALPPTVGPLRSLSCVATRCVAAGTSLDGRALVLWSSDAGRHWRLAHTPRIRLIVRNVFCVASTCVADGTVNLITYQWSLVILRSTDGGATWKEIQRSAAGTVASGNNSSFDPISLGCATTTTCFLAGGDGASVSALLKTTDGGIRWAWISADGYGNATSNVQCTPSGRCVLGAERRPGGGPAALLVSPHPGAPWQVAASFASGQVTAVWCPGKGRCLLGVTAEDGSSVLAVVRSRI